MTSAFKISLFLFVCFSVSIPLLAMDTLPPGLQDVAAYYGKTWKAESPADFSEFVKNMTAKDLNASVLVEDLPRSNLSGREFLYDYFKFKKSRSQGIDAEEQSRLLANLIKYAEPDLRKKIAVRIFGISPSASLNGIYSSAIALGSIPAALSIFKFSRGINHSLFSLPVIGRPAQILGILAGVHWMAFILKRTFLGRGLYVQSMSDLHSPEELDISFYRYAVTIANDAKRAEFLDAKQPPEMRCITALKKVAAFYNYIHPRRNDVFW